MAACTPKTSIAISRFLHRTGLLLVVRIAWALAWPILGTAALPARAVAQSEDAADPGDETSPSEGQPLPESMLSPGEAPLFSIDSPLGPLEYGLGRGLQLGRTGFHLGGFTTVELDRDNGKPGDLELDSVNFLVLFEPNEYVRGFAELEVGDLFAWKTNESHVDTGHSFQVERLYGDLVVGDPLAIRGGKFQTPVGRWNLVAAEPFNWTPIEPAFIEIAFDEHQTGGALVGSVHPLGGTLDYWLYSQFVDPPLDPSRDPVPANHSVGGRLEFGRALEHWSIGSSFLATEIGGDWSFLGGLDTEFRVDRLLVTSELTLQQGTIRPRDLWDVYVQGVYEIVPTFNLVARYEHLDPSHASGDANLVDLGVAWIPEPYIHVLASYRFTDDQTSVVVRGLRMSVSLIF